MNEGRADYVPVFLSDIPELFTTGIQPLDAVFINVSPPDAHGYCSLGTSVDAALSAIHVADTVIAQINPSMPRTWATRSFTSTEIDLGVHVDQPPYQHRLPPVGDVERRIGEYVAELIPDRSTIQMGIGSIPTAVGWPCTTNATSASIPSC